MNITITIGGIDRTSEIVFDSLAKTDAVNEEKDTLSFQVWKYAGRGFVPLAGQEVILTIDTIKEFGGAITRISKSIQAANIVAYEVECCDYSQYLNRELVLESYSEKTVNYIINDILTNYAPEFTGNNVDCDITVKSMLFNRMSVSECLEKLAKETGYYWYVDYDQDIHFFEQETNAAPFSVTDSNGKYLQESLKLTDDLSQIRTVVTIRGSEERGVARSETYTGSADQKIFPLATKFAELPTITVDGSAVNVGLDYIDKEDDFDCFWGFTQKSLRFKVNMNAKKVIITGIPLFPILIRIPDAASMAQYGTYEFFKEDKSITSRAEAYLYAQAQLDAYKNGVIEGEFQTATAGLRSGQIINITSALMGVDEDFLIQSVSMRFLAKDKAVWTVKLATTRTVGIIRVLKDLIRFREIKEFDPENLLTLVQLSDDITIVDDCNVPAAVTSPPYRYGTARYGISTWS